MEGNLRVGLPQCRKDKAFCLVCKATRRQVTQTKVSLHHRKRDFLKAFFYEGFNNWKKALSAFDRHKKSELQWNADYPN